MTKLEIAVENFLGIMGRIEDTESGIVLHPRYLIYKKGIIASRLRILMTIMQDEINLAKSRDINDA